MNAPILITVYNRFYHFQKCIESLLRNDLASDSTLYISSDAPFRKEDVETIGRIRDYASNLNGFREVVPIFHRTNQGLEKCYYKSINRIFEKHNSLIFLEDDIIVSPDFLMYMNDALDYYKNNRRIYSISSFSLSIFYPKLIKNKSEVYFTHRFNPWGFGIWKDRFLSGAEYSLDDLNESLKDKIFVNSLKEIGEDLYPAFLSHLVLKKMLTLDYLSVYHMVKNNLLTVTPYYPKSFNIGLDGTGTRTNYSKKYNSIHTGFLNDKNQYIFSNEIESRINNSFNKMGHNFAVNKLKILLYKIGLLAFSTKANTWVKSHFLSKCKN